MPHTWTAVIRSGPGTHVHSHDIQTNRMSRFVQAKKITGGFGPEYNIGPSIYDKYLTAQAIRRFGT